jgi:hypothetical protein
MKQWRSYEGTFSAVKNLILRFNDATATAYLSKCYKTLSNVTCFRSLERFTFYPSENNHESQFEIFEEIIKANKRSLTQVRFQTTYAMLRLAKVDLRSLERLESLIINNLLEDVFESEDQHLFDQFLA